MAASVAQDFLCRNRFCTKSVYWINEFRYLPCKALPVELPAARLKQSLEGAAHRRLVRDAQRLELRERFVVIPDVLL
jgi:hypothetical protein